MAELFTGCPQCSAVDDIYHAGRAHRAVCHRHRTSWFIGSNLISSWRSEGEAEQRARWQEIADYEDVSRREVAAR